MPSSDHSPEEFFSRHAEAYSKSQSHAQGADLSLLIELLQPRISDVALDVATGTGFTAVQLARRVKQVIAADMTVEMLDQARKFAAEQGVHNIRFDKADAARLPYSDSSFDIVTTRRAAHHFSDIASFLREARRVLRAGGRIGVVDMSPSEGTQDFLNEIERLRDNTHVRALTPDEWKSQIIGSGLKVVSFQVLPDRVTFEGWLYPVKIGGPEESAIREEWTRVPQAIREKLQCTTRNGQVVDWIKNRIVLVAQKS